MKLQNKETVRLMQNKIKNRLDKIEKLQSEIKELERKIMTTSDSKQQYVEVNEEVLVCGRPKKYETKLIGRLNWKQHFTDEDTGESVTIDRSTLVKVNGEFVF